MCDRSDYTDFNPTNFSLLVADSPEQIRKCDVYRLLEAAPIRHLSTLVSWLAWCRDDLTNEVEDCLQDIVQGDDESYLRA